MSVRARQVSRFVIPLFVFMLCMPILFQAGPLLLSPYRLVLIILFIPLVVHWLYGASGRVLLPDIMIASFPLWGAITLIVNHGLATAIEPSGILMVETLSPYLLARIYVRSAKELQTLIRCLQITLIFLVPFVAFESIYNRNVLISDILGSVFPTVPVFDIPLRWGLKRASGVFDHPILFGIFSASIFSFAYYVQSGRKGTTFTIFRVLPSLICTFFSLSSGALTTLMLQIILVTYDVITRWLAYRWHILTSILAAAYIAIDLISNRSPLAVFISYFTFNAHNAWSRIWIWNYGIAEVYRHPVFGIGLNDWLRASWMTPSLDNFWLAITVQYGLPGFLLLAGAVAILLWRGLFFYSEEYAYRSIVKAWLFTIIALVVAAATVHYWKQIYVFFMMILGSGVFALEKRDNKEK